MSKIDTESKMPEHPKMQDQPKMLEQPKVESALAGTPRKGKRMANVLQAVLMPMKMASHAAPKIIDDIVGEPKMTTNVEISSGLDKVDPSGSSSSRHESDKLSRKESLVVPKAMSFKDFEYINHHALGKS
jgi:hypothetical protein